MILPNIGLWEAIKKYIRQNTEIWMQPMHNHNLTQAQSTQEV